MNDEHRHRCEVRHWLRRRAERSAGWLAGMLARIEQARGKEAADRLRADIARQWRRGNRGGGWAELSRKGEGR